ncbi:hypothetical protein [Silvibacterium acidisoli]|uniref:hypothetical protein n=1 Tax=Acidobacteriaceae bacterium ZG23-2 TaxID=2883246 RepID=UPI00406C841F
MKLQTIMDRQRQKAAKLSHTPRKPIKRQPLEDWMLWVLRHSLAAAMERNDMETAKEIKAEIEARRAELKAQNEMPAKEGCDKA